ncbi:MAG: hypothetical protein H0X36_07675 [Sphingomonadaceae bacterium]|nr:hypothetical protein [Sphingomonadaceae bacterium]
MKTFARIALAGIALATLATPAIADDRHVMIVNETNNTMVRFYASNSGRTNWEEDILGERVLKPGQSVRINIDDGTGACLFDFRADFDDGDKLTRNGINVCKLSTYRYTAN